ncbi:MAG: VCBS repeat-containing protein [Planctomycetes bacterium]|jgi:hypothetical protein|nr:VCBS repeat-containing protein [Planctomycetota bacterium]
MNSLPCRLVALFPLLAPLAVEASLAAQTLLEVQPLPGYSLPIQGAITRAVAGDLDNDGDDDLVLAEAGALVILRQNSGVFVREPIVAGAVNAALLALADFDLDGHLDLLHGAPGTFNATVRVWWGDASGSFPTANPFSGPIGISYGNGPMVAGDIDNDGDADLVFRGDLAFGNGGSLLVRYVGGRQFTAAPATQFPDRDSGNSVPFVEDVDGDGLRDVIWVSRNARTRLYWNNAGSFVEATTAEFPLLQRSLSGLAVADFDGDGDRDLVFGGGDEPGVLLRTIGPRTLQIDPQPVTARRTVALLVLDSDADGDPDLHVFSGGQDERLHNDGTGQFSVASRFGGSDGTELVVPIDLDDDGDLDHLRLGLGWLGFSSQTISTIAVRTIAPGRFHYQGGTRLPLSTANVGPTGDLDGDGRLDLLIDNQETTIASSEQVARGLGDGRFAMSWRPGAFFVGNSFFADLDGDGRDDFVIGSAQPGFALRWRRSLGDVLDATAVPLPLPTFAAFQAGAAADFDGDGDLDLVFSQQLGNYQRPQLLRNQGSGTFVDVSASDLSGPPALGGYPDLGCADFDGDGDIDLWLHTSFEQQLWRNQNGVLTFVPAAIPIDGYGPNSASVGHSLGDFDGDGDVDLHVFRKLLRNRGDGTFFAIPVMPNVSGIELLRIPADVDDDGDLDLLGSGLVVWNDGNGLFAVANNVLPFAVGAGIGLYHAFDVDLDGDPDGISTQNNRPVVLVNQLRQLQVVGGAPLGGTLQLRASTRPGSVPSVPFVWIALATATIAPVWQPELGWLQVDPLQATLVGGFALPATGGAQSHLEAIPNAPSLLGATVAAQTVELRGSRLRLGNLVQVLLGQ